PHAEHKRIRRQSIDWRRVEWGRSIHRRSDLRSAKRLAFILTVTKNRIGKPMRRPKTRYRGNWLNKRGPIKFHFDQRKRNFTGINRVQECLLHAIGLTLNGVE